MLKRLKNRIRDYLAYRRLPSVAKKVMEEHLTYLGPQPIKSLLAEISRVERTGVKGDFAEFGVALGGSSIIIASYLSGRRFSGYDVFAQIPSPGANDSEDAHRRYNVIDGGQAIGINGQLYYGYREDLHGQVVKSFERFGLTIDQDAIALHRGFFEDSFRPQPSDRLALVHIDCDWYDPVYFCLTKVSPILSVGGAIILDDFNHFEGCRKAVRQVLLEDGTLTLERTKPHAVLRKRILPVASR